jgi:uncharacterized protein YneF (UPF0154 family)
MIVLTIIAYLVVGFFVTLLLTKDETDESHPATIWVGILIWPFVVALFLVVGIFCGPAYIMDKLSGRS